MDRNKSKISTTKLADVICSLATMYAAKIIIMIVSNALVVYIHTSSIICYHLLKCSTVRIVLRAIYSCQLYILAQLLVMDEILYHIACPRGFRVVLL